MIHGEDVSSLFDPDFNLMAYLERHHRHICIDNATHLSAKKFLDIVEKEAAVKKAMDAAKKATETAPDVVGKHINECLADRTTQNIVNEFAKHYNDDQRIAALTSIVAIYADHASSSDPDATWRTANLTEFARELIDKLPKKHTAADTAFFYEKLSRDFKDRVYHPLLELFADRYQYVAGEEKAKIEERLTMQWDKIVKGVDWVPENPMAIATDAIWTYLGKPTKDHMIKHFVGFIVSNRQSQHRQHALARRALKEEENIPTARDVLKDRAKTAAKSEFSGETLVEPLITKGKQFIRRSLVKMAPYIDNFDELIEGAVNEEIAALKPTNPASVLAAPESAIALTTPPPASALDPTGNHKLDETK